VSFPLPGTSFIYSLLKDVGRWSWTGLRGRRLPRAEAFRRWTVGHWYEPFAAIRQFADQNFAEA
jgi:hypothetical protein